MRAVANFLGFPANALYAASKFERRRAGIRSSRDNIFARFLITGRRRPNLSPLGHAATLAPAPMSTTCGRFIRRCAISSSIDTSRLLPGIVSQSCSGSVESDTLVRARSAVGVARPGRPVAVLWRSLPTLVSPIVSTTVPAPARS